MPLPNYFPFFHSLRRRRRPLHPSSLSLFRTFFPFSLSLFLSLVPFLFFAHSFPCSLSTAAPDTEKLKETFGKYTTAVREAIFPEDYDVDAVVSGKRKVGKG